MQDLEQSAQATTPAPAEIKPPVLESNSNFQAVSTLGAAYLGVAWLLFHLVFSQKVPQVAGGFSFFAMGIQGAFLTIFLAQRSERRAQLNIPTKAIWREDRGDVVLRMLSCLYATAIIWGLIFLAVGLLCSIPGIKVNPFFPVP